MPSCQQTVVRTDFRCYSSLFGCGPHTAHTRLLAGRHPDTIAHLHSSFAAPTNRLTSLLAVVQSHRQGQQRHTGRCRAAAGPGARQPALQPAGGGTHDQVGAAAVPLFIKRLVVGGCGGSRCCRTCQPCRTASEVAAAIGLQAGALPLLGCCNPSM